MLTLHKCFNMALTLHSNSTTTVSYDMHACMMRSQCAHNFLYTQY